MSDLISRQAAIDAIQKLRDFPTVYNCTLIDKTDAQTKIMMLPFAEPEIIRCKDCKDWVNSRCINRHANLDNWRVADDFCSYAERKEDERLNQQK